MTDHTPTAASNFAHEAAEIGSQTFHAIAAEKDMAKRVEAVRKDATAASDNVKRQAAGFRTARFDGLAKVAGIFQQRFNDPDSKLAKDAAKEGAEAYLNHMTGATDKTKEGGRGAGAAAVIRLGAKARVMLDALQARVDYWQSVYESEPDKEDAGNRKLRRETAARFLAVPGPKHNGRPGKRVNGVTIKASAATNRDSQVAAAALMLAANGDKFLDPNVLDAFLDNGGKADKPEETTEEMAKRIRGDIDLLAQAMPGSPDTAELMALTDVLDRIIKRGVAESGDATPAGGPESEADPAEVLSGTQSEPETEAPKAAKAPRKRAGLGV